MAGVFINRFIYLSKIFLKLYLSISISVFLFVLFFQPFPVLYFDFENNLFLNAGYGFIIFIILVITQIIFQRPLFFYKKKRKYNTLIISLYYFSLLFLTSVAFIFFIRYLGNIFITFSVVLRVVVVCLSVPVTVHLKNSLSLMQKQNKKLLEENMLMHRRLKKFLESYTNKFIELNSENLSDNIKLKVSEIIFFKSADNYVEVGFWNGVEVRKKMIRNTLKNIEQQLKNINVFLRTHRSSIVNIQYIDKLNKNYNTYWLSLIDTKEIVPVSRQYLMVVKELF